MTGSNTPKGSRSGRNLRVEVAQGAAAKAIAPVALKAAAVVPVVGPALAAASTVPVVGTVVNHAASKVIEHGIKTAGHAFNKIGAGGPT